MTIVGRAGHMDPDSGEYMEDAVTVHVIEPGGWAVYANDESEEQARARGLEAIEAAKAEMREQVAGRVAAGMMTADEAERLREEANL